MAWAVRGVIEGFYGTPWSWDDRVAVMRWCAARGMTHYVYAPKDDPKHRVAWRQPYAVDELAGFARLVEEAGVAVGFAISPGLSIDYRAAGDRDALLSKIDTIVGAGVGLVVLALDDIPPRPGLGDEHADLCCWLLDRLAGRADLVLVPTDYTNVTVNPYLEALARRVPPDVAIAWTGRLVVNDAITAADAHARAGALGERPPLLWDNYPVNDGIMTDRLFLGPLRRRDPGLEHACAGYLSNPMVQPRSSMLPLASVAGFLRGDDPERVWTEEADALGLRAFAEACDGEVPGRLVAALAQAAGGPEWSDAADELGRWLDGAAGCGAPGLDGEADAWLTQVHDETRVAQAALRVFRACRPQAEAIGDGRTRPRPPGGADVFGDLGVVLLRSAALRRTPVSVMGPRWSLRPAMGQRPDGSWDPRRELLQADANATDALVHLALGGLDPPDPGAADTVLMT